MTEERRQRLNWIRAREANIDCPKSTPESVATAEKLLEELGDLYYGMHPTIEGGVEFTVYKNQHLGTADINSDGKIDTWGYDPENNYVEELEVTVHQAAMFLNIIGGES